MRFRTRSFEASVCVSPGVMALQIANDANYYAVVFLNSALSEKTASCRFFRKCRRKLISTRKGSSIMLRL